MSEILTKVVATAGIAARTLARTPGLFAAALLSPSAAREAIAIEERLMVISTAWPSEAEAARAEIARRARTTPLTYLDACHSVEYNLSRGVSFAVRRVDAPTDSTSD